MRSRGSRAIGCATRRSRTVSIRISAATSRSGVTANLTADFTVNTDFAQVEIDEQQVNLTRFNLFFPEKRDFFLEGRGVFDFGRGGSGSGNRPTRRRPATRRISFTAAASASTATRVTPIDAGARLTGKVGAFGVGLINIQAGDVEATHDAAGTAVDQFHRAARQARHPAPQHDRRDVHQPFGVDGGAGASNQAYGVDGVVCVLPERHRRRLLRASTETERRDGNDDSYQGKFEYVPDRYGVRAEFLKVGTQLQPRSRLRSPHRFHQVVGRRCASARARATASRPCANSPRRAPRVFRKRRRPDGEPAADSCASTPSSTTAISSRSR